MTTKTNHEVSAGEVCHGGAEMNFGGSSLLYRSLKAGEDNERREADAVQEEDVRKLSSSALMTRHVVYATILRQEVAKQELRRALGMFTRYKRLYRFGVKFQCLKVARLMAAYDRMTAQMLHGDVLDYYDGLCDAMEESVTGLLRLVEWDVTRLLSREETPRQIDGDQRFFLGVLMTAHSLVGLCSQLMEKEALALRNECPAVGRLSYLSIGGWEKDTGELFRLVWVEMTGLNRVPGLRADDALNKNMELLLRKLNGKNLKEVIDRYSEEFERQKKVMRL